jgi:antitoxin component YwqK of YwqJK toxin-antitoxin module
MKYVKIFVISIIIISLLELLLAANISYWFPALDGNPRPFGALSAISISIIVYVTFILTAPATWIVYTIWNLLGVGVQARSPMMTIPVITLLTSGIGTFLVYGIDSLSKFCKKSGEYPASLKDNIPKAGIPSTSFWVWSSCGVLWLVVVMMIIDLFFYKGGLLTYKKDFKDYYENGQVRRKWTSVDGVIEGKAVTYYESGKLSTEQFYENGKEDGQFQSFYENGNTQATVTYVQGEKDGRARYYYENGHVHSEGFFKNNKSDGLWKFYFETGQLKTEEMHKNDKKNGLFKKYIMNGHLSSEGEYLDDKAHGTWKWFYTNGNLGYTAEYARGNLISKYRCYDNVPQSTTGEDAGAGYECPEGVERNDYTYTEEVRRLADKGFQLYKESRFINSYNGGYYTDPDSNTMVLDFWSDGKKAKVDRDGNGHHETIFEIKDGQLIYVGTLGSDGKYVDRAGNK